MSSTTPWKLNPDPVCLRRSDSPVYQSSQQTSGTRARALPLNSSPITAIGVNDTTKEIKCSSESRKTTAAHDQE